ncbi:MAG TPA: 1,4-alpha-glucan branching protein GlgB [Longimicrobiales bacterium]|nr:1,4-alpha-glucan branching protein GlgB [Longimicrobiales bacterium]
MTPEALAAADALASGSCASPFDILGLHPVEEGKAQGRVVRCFIPWARSVRLLRNGTAPREMERVSEAGLFELVLPGARTFFEYRLGVEDPNGAAWEMEDPYRFLPALDEERARGFLDGHERRAHQVLGARTMVHQGVRGTLFAVWAPHARAVSVMGDMNGWDGRCHPMRPRGALGVWELFIPEVEAGARYKYQILTARGERVEKADPFGRASELRPATASEVWDDEAFRWGDGVWMASRGHRNWEREAISVYEVHAGSWRRHPREQDETGWLTYRELADQLIPYVQELGFTHIELLPVQEHPLDQSWGYQAVGFFAPTSRFGTPDDFRYLVDRAHQAGVGVILDWVPGHFPTDVHGLARFDGTPLYEHPDPLQAWHPDWGTLTFNYGSPAVRAFLVSSALHWLEDYHLDGLRVDAVASMLYLDYSRPDGQWRPNVHGGRENLEAVSFLRELNDAVHAHCPGALMIAEESTAWPGVSHGTDRGGLGFDQKWNMGWMNDTLNAVSTDPLYRKWRYDKFTFSLMYAFSERFVLPFSHDEVVHGKGSLLGKMPGPDSEKRANLRALLAYQWAHPGKKLLFMGSEMGQWKEWNVDDQLDWPLLDHPAHRGIHRLVGDLNRVYREEPALHALDFQPRGFEWIDCHDADRVILSFLRWSPEWEDFVAVVANLTPVPRGDFVLGVPWPGRYRVLLNTDAPEYGGSGMAVPPELEARPGRVHSREHMVDLPLPGLAVVYLRPVRGG